MLCVADYLDALDWIGDQGGVAAAIDKSLKNLSVIEAFVEANDWINFLAEEVSTRSNTSVCLTLDLEATQIKILTEMLGQEGVAYDIGAYRDAPAGLRIWCGATVEQGDLEALLPWLEWAYRRVST